MAFRLRLLSVLVLMIAAMRPAAALDIDLSTFTLGNGMQVVVIPDRRAPVVTHMVWYRIGAADEPQGKAGIAHFLEHLMFKGTKELKPGEFSRRVHELTDALIELREFSGVRLQIIRIVLNTAFQLREFNLGGLEALKHLGCAWVDPFQIMDAAPDLTKRIKHSAFTITEAIGDGSTQFS